MKLMFRKVLPAGFIVFLSSFFLLNSFAFSDISGHWAEEAVYRWAEKEAVRGLPDGTFRPDANITRAEFVTIINNVMKYENKSDEKYIDVPANEWYAENVAKAVAAGVTVGIGNGRFGPMNLITRQEAAVMIYRAFRMQVKNPNAADKFSDTAHIAPWAKGAVSTLAENGYVSGRPGNKFAPLEYITRAEALKIIDNILSDIAHTPGKYSGAVQKNLLVNTRDVELKDMTINGNLYLSEGIGNGNIILEGVTVKGNILISGGGNSIILNNTTVEGTLYVLKYDGKVRIVARGNTEIKNTQVLSGVKLEEENITAAGFRNVHVVLLKQGEKVILNGDFDDVDINTPGAGVVLEKGSASSMEIRSGGFGTMVELSVNSEIDTVKADAYVAVRGGGTVKNAEIRANMTTFEMVPENYTVYKGVIAIIGGTAVKGGYVS